MNNDTRLISLSQGKTAIVDTEDYEWLVERKWSLHHTSNRRNFYAITPDCFAVPQKNLFMHREILLRYGHELGKLQVDHINGNGLDNRKCNLRLVTQAQNCMNMRARSNDQKTSIYKGVRFHKTSKRWEAYIRCQYKRIHIGSFKTESEAAIAYNWKALELFGEFARFNVLRDDNIKGD